MLWILMALDVIAFVSLTLAHFQIAFSTFLLVLSAVYLIGKWLVFKDVMSGIDAVSGIYIAIVLIFHVSTFMYYLVMAWFVYKLVFTISK